MVFALRRAPHSSLRSLSTLTVGLAMIGTLLGSSQSGLAQTSVPCDSTAHTSTVATPGPTMTATIIPTEAPAQPEDNPPGDIPDNQAFVTYTSATGGYSITMPEGWSRQESGTDVVFSDKLHQFSVEIQCTAAAPDEASASASTEAGGSLSTSIPAFELIGISSVDLPSGPAVLVQYRTNSEADPVTGSQHRLDVDSYEIYQDGKLAIVSLSSPAGSDNVDVSRQVSESFQWTS